MHTFSAVPPGHENIHPDWIGRFSAAMCAKHLGGMEGDGARALQVTAAIPAWGDAEVTATITITTDAISASVAGADMAVEPVPTRPRRGKSARRGRDDEYYRHKWLRKADDPSAPRNGSETPPHGGGGART